MGEEFLDPHTVVSANLAFTDSQTSPTLGFRSFVIGFQQPADRSPPVRTPLTMTERRNAQSADRDREHQLASTIQLPKT